LCTSLKTTPENLVLQIVRKYTQDFVSQIHQQSSAAAKADFFFPPFPPPPPRFTLLLVLPPLPRLPVPEDDLELELTLLCCGHSRSKKKLSSSCWQKGNYKKHTLAPVSRFATLETFIANIIL
jgi:hypothetical protein